MRQGWKNNRSPGKMQLLDVKQQQLEDVLKSSQVIREKDDKIQQLQIDLGKYAEDIQQKKQEIKHLSSYVDEMKNKHKFDIERQKQFNNANDKTLQRLTERERECTIKLKSMNKDMGRAWIEFNLEPRGVTPAMVDPYGEDMDISPLDHAMSNVEKILTLLADLFIIKEKYDKLVEERESMCRLLGVERERLDGVNVIGVLKLELEDQDKKMTKAKTDNDGLQERLAMLIKIHEEDNSISMRDQVKNLENVVDTLKKEIISKDDVIRKLTEIHLKNQTAPGAMQNEKISGVSFTSKPNKGGVSFVDSRAGKVKFSEPENRGRSIRLAQGRPPSKKTSVVVRQNTPYRGLRNQQASSSDTESVSGSDEIDMTTSSDSDNNEVGPFITRSVMSRNANGINIDSTANPGNSSNQNFLLPPLHKHMEYKISSQRAVPQQPSYSVNIKHKQGQVLAKGAASKTTHSMATGATKISQREMMNPKSMMHIQAAGRSHQGGAGMLHVSSMSNAGKNTPGGIKINFSKVPGTKGSNTVSLSQRGVRRPVGSFRTPYATQQSVELKRNHVSFYR